MNVKKTRTVGVIVDAVHEPYQSGIWRGIAEQAAKRQVNLISFVGTSQDGIDHFDTHYDMISDFATSASLDGVIVFSGSITEHHGKSFVRQLCGRFGETPLVCVSEQVAGFPSIIVENGPGIEAIVAHLVTVHNISRIAFVKGPDGHIEAEERLSAYKSGLEKNGLPYRPELVLDGGFIARDGAAAIERLIASGVEFNGVITVNDDSAFGVLDALFKAGLHVPGDVVVAGFDDVVRAAMVQPSLSTVRQPLHQMGVEALEQVLARIEKNHVEPKVVMPTMPVLRRSCGCFSDEVQNAKAVHRHIRGMTKVEILENLVSTSMSIIDAEHPEFSGKGTIKGLLRDLVESLIWDVKKPAIRNIFLNEIDMLLFKVRRYVDGIDLVSAILRDLMIYVTSLFEDAGELADANNLLQQAVTFIQERVSIQANIRTIEKQHFQLQVNVAGQRIISCNEQRALLESMAAGFPTLGIDSFAVVLFSDGGMDRSRWTIPPTSDLQLLLAYDVRADKVVYPRGKTPMTPGEVFPTTLVGGDDGRNRLFMPLFFKSEYLGYVVFEFNPKAPFFMYEELRLHVSSAVKSSALLRKFRRQSLVDELTGVYNRRGFLEMAQKVIDQAAKHPDERVFLFYADVDHLKQINDEHSHSDGDLAICNTAMALRQTFRERDVIGRIGGDEFVVVLSSRQEKGLVEKVTSRLSQVLLQSNKTLDRPWRLSITIGVAMRSSGDETIDRLMSRADVDLRSRKSARPEG